MPSDFLDAIGEERERLDLDLLARAFDYSQRAHSGQKRKSGEPDLMVIYNEGDRAQTVGNLGDWSQGDWNILARSWFGDDADVGDIDHWEANCPDAGGSVEIKARSLAVLVSDND